VGRTAGRGCDPAGEAGTADNHGSKRHARELSLMVWRRLLSRSSSAVCHIICHKLVLAQDKWRFNRVECGSFSSCRHSSRTGTTCARDHDGACAVRGGRPDVRCGLGVHHKFRAVKQVHADMLDADVNICAPRVVVISL
jgi:hypothetical protein